MRKEENLDLIKRLASTKVDTGLLKSSRDLGVKNLPKREILARALDEAKAGVNVEQNNEILFEKGSGSQDSSSEFEVESERRDEVSNGVEIKSPQPSQPLMTGSGLKRPLELDMDGLPLIKRRKRKITPSIRFMSAVNDADETSWDGFSASDSISIEKSSIGGTSDSSDPVSEEDTDDTSESGDFDVNDRKIKSSAFSAWARSQINEAVGFTPSAAPTLDTQASKHPPEKPNNESKKLQPIDGVSLPPELSVGSTDVARKSHSVIVQRSESSQASRMELPIAGEEQRIMEAIYNHPTVIVCGETGSGKTTQVPQFLFEAGFGNKDSPTSGLIGVTQPRRVAAVSMASRVATELGDDHKAKVAHQVRFDSSVSKDTVIKFMTDGILLREIAADFALTKYSAVVVDEAHERSMNTDVLTGLLSRIVDLRGNMHKDDHGVEPLKLVIMSATLRIGDFVKNKMLFRNNPPPLVEVEGRQHPVTMHFSRTTASDYVDQAFQKVYRGHRRLPPGAMLVFLTAQDEISLMIRRLEREFTGSNGNGPMIDADEDEPSQDEADEFDIEDLGQSSRTAKVHLLPLYSQLQTKEQLRVFEPPPDGARLIVVATNVAETSLTIPGVRYVFDCGRSKEKQYDEVSGVQSFAVNWISKASASQRAGRAGRTGPGHCYRLYSSAVYERDFLEHSEPEILRMPIEGVVLHLKSMELHNVVNFPFPSPPDRQGLAKAERLLKSLGALSKDGMITDTGKALTRYPISPRYAKMLAVGHQFKCMALTIILVAALATPNIFIPESILGILPQHKQENMSLEEQQDQEAKLKRRSDYNHAHHSNSKLSRSSDALKLFSALQSYIKTDDKEQYCRSTFLSAKPMHEASSLVEQLTSITRDNSPLQSASSTSQKASPSKDQIAALQQFTAAGFLDQIAILASESPSPPFLGRNPKRAADVPYLPLHPVHDGRHAADANIRDVAVYPHPSSVVAHLAVKEMPKYLIYSHLQRAQPSTIAGVKTPRTRMHALTTVTEQTILALARGTPLLEYGKPLKILEEGSSAKGKTRTCIVQPNLVSEKGVTGWPLPAQKVSQVRDKKGEWNVQ